MVLCLSVVVDVGDRNHTKPPLQYKCDSSDNGTFKPLYTVHAMLGSFSKAL
jgi:hypothetical protein